MNDNLGFYEAFASVYTQYYANARPRKAVEIWANLLRKHELLPPNQAALLDLGCGPGWHLRPWQQMGFEVAGIDASPSMLRVAAELAEAGTNTDVPLYCADLRKPRQFHSLRHRFSIAVAHFRFLNLQSPRELQAVFASVSTLLTSGGRFVTDYSLSNAASSTTTKQLTETVGAHYSREAIDSSGANQTINWKIEGREYREQYWFHSIDRLRLAAASVNLVLVIEEPLPELGAGCSETLLVFQQKVPSVHETKGSRNPTVSKGA